MRVSEVERNIATVASKNAMGLDFSRIVDALLSGPQKLTIADFGYKGEATIEQALTKGVIEVFGPTNARPKTYQLTGSFNSAIADLIARAASAVPLGGLILIKYRQQRKELNLLSEEAGLSIKEFKELFIDGFFAFTEASQQQIDSGFLRPLEFMSKNFFIKSVTCLEYQKMLAKRFDDSFAAAKPQRVEHARAKRNDVRTASERLDRYVDGLLSAIPVDEEVRHRYKRFRLHTLINRLAASGLKPSEITRLTGISLGKVTWSLYNDVGVERHIVPNPVPEVCVLAAQRSFSSMRYFHSILQDIVASAFSGRPTLDRNESPLLAQGRQDITVEGCPPSGPRSDHLDVPK